MLGIFTCELCQLHTLSLRFNHAKFQDMLSRVSHSETIVAAMTYKPNDFVATDRHKLFRFLETVEFAVCQEIAHQLPAYHAERHKRIAFLNRTDLNLVCNHISIKICDIRARFADT